MTTSTRFQVFWNTCVQDLYRVFPKSIPDELLTLLEDFRHFSPATDSDEPTLFDASAVADSLNEVAQLEQLIKDFHAAAPSIFESVQSPVVSALDSFTAYTSELLSLYPKPDYQQIPKYLITPIAAACRIRSNFRSLNLIPSPKLDIRDRFSLLKNPPHFTFNQLTATRPNLLRIITNLAGCGTKPLWHFPTAEQQDLAFRKASRYSFKDSSTTGKRSVPLFKFS